ncbi:unnamed protein product [Prorocentrum cordatum]|uniref:RRM domain-containing protein n=1 Tax=Prorocentrum cordatum TaxID=2364126 RepID=A0ABN9W407_9DINO|nr:unnamed protein product [Polarella glacialis]
MAHGAMDGQGKGAGKRGARQRKPAEGVDINTMLDDGAEPPPEWGDTTTVMMRNLPNKYTQRMLLTEVNEVGFIGTFDFLYLPIDPETNANRGYCFVNFVSPSASWMFKKAFEGRAMSFFNSKKVVSVAPATLQGFEANYAHYSSARVNRGDPATRPLFLREPDQLEMSAQMYRGDARGSRLGSRPSAGSGPRGAARQHRAGGPRPSMDALGLSEDAYGVAGAEGAQPHFGMGGAMFQVPYPGGGAAPTAADVGAGAAPQHRFCPQCGGAIQAIFQFCPQCGASLDALR